MAQRVNRTAPRKGNIGVPGRKMSSANLSSNSFFIKYSVVAKLMNCWKNSAMDDTSKKHV